MKIYEINGRKVWLDHEPECAAAVKTEKTTEETEPKAKPVTANKARKAPANKTRKDGAK